MLISSFVPLKKVYFCDEVRNQISDKQRISTRVNQDKGKSL